MFIAAASICPSAGVAPASMVAQMSVKSLASSGWLVLGVMVMACLLMTGPVRVGGSPLGVAARRQPAPAKQGPQVKPQAVVVSDASFDEGERSSERICRDGFTWGGAGATRRTNRHHPPLARGIVTRRAETPKPA